MTAGRDLVAVAALQYCAAGTAEETLRTLMPLIDRAADDGAKLVCLPEAATFLAAAARGARGPRRRGPGTPARALLRALEPACPRPSPGTPGRAGLASVPLARIGALYDG